MYDSLDLISIKSALEEFDPQSASITEAAVLEQQVVGALALLNRLTENYILPFIYQASGTTGHIFEAYQDEFEKKGVVSLPSEMLYLSVPYTLFKNKAQEEYTLESVISPNFLGANVYDIFTREHKSTIGANYTAIENSLNIIESLFDSTEHQDALEMYQILRDEDLRDDYDDSMEAFQDSICSETELFKNVIEGYTSIIDALDYDIINIINLQAQYEAYFGLDF